MIGRTTKHNIPPAFVRLAISFASTRQAKTKIQPRNCHAARRKPETTVHDLTYCFLPYKIIISGHTSDCYDFNTFFIKFQHYLHFHILFDKIVYYFQLIISLIFGFPEKLFKNVLKDILILPDFASKKMFCGTTRSTNIFFLILSICTSL